jgi:hypothetical protein
LRKLVPLLLLAGCAQPSDMRSDWERRNLPVEPAPEEARAMPAYPTAARLLEVPIADGGSFRYYVDPASLSAGRDGIVRYTVVARSPAGSENVFYEGLRCARRQYRIYAIGRADGTWGGRQGDWQPLAASGAQPWRAVLFSNYFCPHSDPVRTAAEGVQALELGGHPSARIER